MKLQIHGASASQLAVIHAFFAWHERSLAHLGFDITIGRLPGMEREAFRALATLTGDVVTAELDVTDSQSVRWALNGLRGWLSAGAAAPLALTDRPQFRWRGVIEGFYGHPWTHEQRARGIKFFGDFGMNLFLLAPKDAAWQRLRWRDPLSAEFVTQMRELVALGNMHGVDVSGCVSPGLSVQYCSDADVAAVVAKFSQLAEVGATHVGLLLDDISDTLAGTDIEHYPSVAHAHTDFANRVREGLVAEYPGMHVILCPMHYAGRGTEPYLQVMGDFLHPQIELMWTGREICSAYLDISDAIIFDRTARRPPFYWDNYPVNDLAMARHLHIGPYHGREAGLHRYSAGLLANPMDRFEASLLPLGTIGAYLWNTDEYDPFVAWERVLVDLVVDAEDRAAFREFLRNALGLRGTWAPAFNGFLEVCDNARRAAQPEIAAVAARAHAVVIRNSLARIERDGFCAQALRDEVEPWLRKYALGAQILDELAEVLDSCVPTGDGGLAAPTFALTRLLALREQFNADSPLLFGDGFDMTLFAMTTEITFTL